MQAKSDAIEGKQDGGAIRRYLELPLCHAKNGSFGTTFDRGNKRCSINCIIDFRTRIQAKTTLTRQSTRLTSSTIAGWSNANLKSFHLSQPGAAQHILTEIRYFSFMVCVLSCIFRPKDPGSPGVVCEVMIYSSICSPIIDIRRLCVQYAQSFPPLPN